MPDSSRKSSASGANPVEGRDELPGRRIILGTVWLIALTLLAYLPSLNAGFIWDDDQYILENRTLRSPEGLVRIWTEPTSIPQYYPLVHTTYWMEYQLWGDDPLGYHLINALVHALAALMLWLVLRRLKVPGAYLAALVFAIHPVHVESVAWVTERKNTLSGLMYLWSALVLLPFFGIRRERLDDGSPSWGQIHWQLLTRYGIALLLFLAALLSKSVTASLPAAMLLMVYWKFGRIRFRDVVWLLPFFAVGIAAGLHTAWLEKHHVGAQGADFDLSFIQRCLIASRAIVFYAWSLVWPSELTFFYYRWHVDPRFWWQWLFPAGLLVTLAGLWFGRHRIGRGPIVAACFFCGTLFPALGFINVYPMRFSFVADHFQYHASIGVIALIVGSLAWGYGRLPSLGQAAAKGAAVGVVALFILITANQSRIYESKETLYRDVLRKNDTAFIAYTNLGTLLVKKANEAEARGETEQAAAIRKEARQMLMQGYLLMPDAKSLWNLGLIALAQGDPERAVEIVEVALRLEPTLGMWMRFYAQILLKAGETDKASDAYEQILAQERPEHAKAYFLALLELSELLLKQEPVTEANRKRALNLTQQAMDLTEGKAPLAVFGHAQALRANGKISEAREQLDRAAQLIAGDLERFGHLQARVFEAQNQLEQDHPE